MASAKYQELARDYLLEEIDGLAAWLEGNVKRIRAERSDSQVIVLTRKSHFIPDEDGDYYTFGSIQFEIDHGNEVL